MYIKTKIVTRKQQLRVRIKSLNWQGTLYGLEVNGEIIKTGSEEVIQELYDRY